MIHYNQIQNRFLKLTGEELLILKVSGMLSPGKNKTDGEPRPPKIANGTLVKVVEAGTDQVKVATEDGKTTLVFSHSTGARRLEYTRLTGFPKVEVKK